MGLDMYLYAEKHISAYDFESVNGEMTRKDNLEYDKVIEASGLNSIPTAEYGSVRVTKCVAYWRKANAIHGWIVRNCADGVDECQRISMDRDDLIALRNACVVGLQDRDKAVPTQESEVYTIDSGSENSTVKSIMEAFAKETARSSRVILDEGDDPIPPVSGFFFGSTEKDEYYYRELAETAETINSILASDIEGEYDYHYQASW
jgi:hypothetical protein